MNDSTHTDNGTYPAHPLLAVGAVVFHENRVLLIHRGNPPAEGIWAIPGGKVKLGETLQQAAKREILEETGLTIRAGKPVFTFEMVDRDDTGRVRYHYVIIDLAAEYVHGQIKAGDDARAAGWISVEKMSTLPVSDITIKLLKDRFEFG